MTVSRPTGGKGYVLCSYAAGGCVPLDLYPKYGIPMVRGSGLIVKVSSPDRCLACQKCVKRCIFSAVYLEGNRPALAEDKCLGCGLCVSACPVQIRYLDRSGASEALPGL